MTGRTRALVWLVASIAVIAFLESYQGLLHAAQAGGRPMPIVWPWAVEGFTLAMNLVIWDARAHARRAGWAWTLLIAATTLSTTLQVLDALNQPPPNPHDALSGWQTGLRVLTGAWTPVALLLSFERCIWLLYATPRRRPQPAGQAAAPAGTATPVPTPAQPSTWPPSPPSPSRPTPSRQAARPPAAAQPGRSTPSQAGDRALLDQARALNAEALAARGRPISRDKLRAALGIGATRAERLLAALYDPPPAGDEQGGLVAPVRPAVPPRLPAAQRGPLRPRRRSRPGRWGSATATPSARPRSAPSPAAPATGWTAVCRPAVGCPAPHHAHGQGGGTMLLVAVTCAALLLAPHLTLPRLPGQPATRPRLATTLAARAGATPSPAAGVVAARAIGFALAQLGKPYQWGQQGPASFDCSGLTWAAYRHAGLAWTRATADTQYHTTPRVTGPLLPGDPVFFHTSRVPPRHAGHVGLYLGAGRMVEAPNPGSRVRTSATTRAGYLGATRPALLATAGGGGR